MLTSREVILCKEESTYNTDAAPTASADAILISNPSWANEGLRMIERDIVKSTLGKKKSIFGGTLKTVTFDVEIKGSGTAGTAPDLGVLLEICGFTETVVAVTSVTYDPESAPASMKSGTLWYYQDGLIHKLTGCRGNVTCNLETGNVGMFSFTITGHSVAPVDGAIVTPTVDATDPVAIVGTSFTIDSYAATINSLAFDMSNTVSTPPDMNASDGFGEIYIAQRDPNGTFDPEMELVATEDFYGNFSSGAAMALTTGAIGATAGNIVTVTMPAVSYRDISPGDRDGIRTYELAYGAAESSGDDQVAIAFT